ncbi:hypothetical protein HPB48_012535 [Haemaphysalis longicornis]|uniref:Serpin domain-containing protein n=1 Tax=Haemaphysalis longicornis TaxID=44386 RepID=A0A9J6GMW3_HAELO|nr:hypothetical protein HPB48_012535 [Haemaphysalis longicornis]
MPPIDIFQFHSLSTAQEVYVRDVCSPTGAWTSPISSRRFKLETKYYLKDTFKRVGIRSVFNPHKADLSGVTGHKELHLDDVIHKAVIEVDEKGTKAAAASAAIMDGASLGGHNDEFYADHPFMFWIRSKNTGVLFMGEVNSL